MVKRASVSSSRVNRARGRAVAALCLSVALVSCEDASGPEVSDTVVWRLELEQVDDGSSGDWAGRRRGTMHMLLRLNRTTTPDPACAASANPNATTFLASVEALPSRLQGPTTGNAVGTWNCFGFGAEVRLDDGVTYALTSNDGSFASYDLGQGDIPAYTWRAGQRSGFFRFAPDSTFGPPYDTHFDVRVDDRRGRREWVGVSYVDGNYWWAHRALRYCLSEGPSCSDPDGSGVDEETEGFGKVYLAAQSPTVGMHTLSWPSRASEWSLPASDSVAAYSILVGPGDYLYKPLPGREGNIREIVCYLNVRTTPRADLIIHPDGTLECGTGWLRGLAFIISPSRLFMRAGSVDSVRVHTTSSGTLSARSSEASLGMTVSSEPVSNWKVIVSSAPTTPRREHGVILTLDQGATEETRTLPVEVYGLEVDAAPDTLRIAAGDSAGATLRLARDGLVGLDVRLEVPQLPQGVLLAPPSLSPSVTRGDSSHVNLRVDATAAPGTYPLRVCAVIVGDPRATCHAAELTLVVPAPPACRAAAPIAWNRLHGDATDASGMGNHGTVSGAVPAPDRQGNAGGALQFDGVDDRIELGARFDDLALPFSVAAWVRQPTSARGDLRGIFVTDDEPGRYAGIWLQVTDAGAPQITYGDGGPVGAGARRTLQGTSPMPADAWVHVAATVRGPTDMTLYVNGAPVQADYSGTGGPLVHSSAPARIGWLSIIPANRPWAGELDEVRVYSCSLDASEVARLLAPN
jgi:hypothetical protein